MATSTMVNNLGYLLKQQENFDAAKEAYADALERRREIFGKDHPNVLVTMQNLSELERSMGNGETAVSLQNEILKILDDD